MTQTVDISATPSGSLPLPDRPLAGPWARLWARVVDIHLWSIITGLAILSASPAALEEVFPEGGLGDFLATLLLVPVILLLDALVQSLFGSTPGKVLAGIRIETIDGRRPGLGKVLARNLVLWVKGLGFGIPIVTLFTAMAAYMTMKAGRRLSWDSHADTRVISKSSNIFRTLLTFGVVVAIMAGYFALFMMDVKMRADEASEIRKLNAQLPLQADPYTRLDSLELTGGVVTFSYTMVNANGAPSATPLQLRRMRNESFRQIVAESYCRSSAVTSPTAITRKARYRYRALDGEVVADFTFSPEVCAVPTP